MGCSESKPAATNPAFKAKLHSDHGHGFNLSAIQSEMDKPFDPDKLQDPVSSWEVKPVPEGYPRDKLLPPDRQLHEKHMRKLNKFLKKVEDTSYHLGEACLRQLHFSNSNLFPSRLPCGFRVGCWR